MYGDSACLRVKGENGICHCVRWLQGQPRSSSRLVAGVVAEGVRSGMGFVLACNGCGGDCVYDMAGEWSVVM